MSSFRRQINFRVVQIRVIYRASARISPQGDRLEIGRGGRWEKAGSIYGDFRYVQCGGSIIITNISVVAVGVIDFIN